MTTHITRTPMQGVATLFITSGLLSGFPDVGLYGQPNPFPLFPFLNLPHVIYCLNFENGGLSRTYTQHVSPYHSEPSPKRLRTIRRGCPLYVYLSVPTFTRKLDSSVSSLNRVLKVDGGLYASVVEVAVWMHLRQQV